MGVRIRTSQHHWTQRPERGTWSAPPLRQGTFPYLLGRWAEFNDLKAGMQLHAGPDVSLSMVFFYSHNMLENTFFRGNFIGKINTETKYNCSLNQGLPSQKIKKEDRRILFCAELDFLQADTKTQSYRTVPFRKMTSVGKNRGKAPEVACTAGCASFLSN